mmetsp:Transcript_136030/g.302967  ORF Transcript_136030/g.302967 Transcript_136030/m.302967 type:complete len:378 (+) Transcript_136030:98-1231(+)
MGSSDKRYALHEDPGPDAPLWQKLQSIGGPWYRDLTPEQCIWKPQHRGEDKDPWRLEAVEPGPPQQQASLGTELPVLKRSKRCPGQSALPDVIVRGYDTSTVEKHPKVYVLAFPGAADAVMQGWAKQEVETADHFEWGTYEWPGHGVRSSEPPCTDIGQIGADAFDTFKEAMSTGHFILIGHSIGVLIMTYVCMRAERELGVKPLCCFALDRTAPHQMVYSAYSEYLRTTDVKKWISYKWPTIQTEAGMIEASNDEALQIDTLPLGSYKFPCKVYAFIALWLSSKAPNLAELEKNEQSRSWAFEASRLYCNGKGFNFEPAEFEEWRKWADIVDIRKVQTDHKGVVLHNSFLTVLYKEISDLLKKASKTVGKKQPVKK